jgi:Ca2+-binding RTX toxin-like protein
MLIPRNGGAAMTTQNITTSRNFMIEDFDVASPIDTFNFTVSWASVHFDDDQFNGSTILKNVSFTGLSGRVSVFFDGFFDASQFSNPASVTFHFGGSLNSDYMLGTASADEIFGGYGNDTLFGGIGSDLVNGGPGDDHIIWHNGDGSDQVNGDLGFDVQTVFMSDTGGDNILLQAVGNVARLDRSNLGLFNLEMSDVEQLSIVDGGGHNNFTVVNSLAGTDLIGGIRYEGSPHIDTVDAAAGNVVLNAHGMDGNDVLTGGSQADTLDGGPGADKLVGAGGNDLLIGGISTDSLNGGAGNDTFVLGDGADTVVDASGIDTITSTISRSLANFASVENLALINVEGALTGTGNNLNNAISGNNLNNTLIGGIGNDVLRGRNGSDVLTGGPGIDTLIGGAQSDFFVFNAPLNIANRDVLTDFSNVAGNNDAFRLEDSVMTQLGGAGALAANKFFAGATAHDADDRIVYNQANGALTYDANGNAAGGSTLLAVLTNKPALTFADFVVI